MLFSLIYFERMIRECDKGAHSTPLCLGEAKGIREPRIESAFLNAFFLHVWIAWRFA